MTLFRRGRHALPKAVRGLLWRTANPFITVWNQDQSIRQRVALGAAKRITYRLLENACSVLEACWLLALMVLALLGIGIPFCILWAVREIYNTWTY